MSGPLTPPPRGAITKKKSQRESQIEHHLVQRVEEIGGLCLKFVSPGRVGVPDRIVILPGGEVIWVELKAPGGKVSPAQARMHKRLRELTQEVRVVWSDSQIRRLFPIEEQDDTTNGC